MAQMESICTKLESGVGFSHGWALFALKYPPPLVPSILIASCDATGPRSSDCVEPSRAVHEAGPASVWMTPCETRKSA